MINLNNIIANLNIKKTQEIKNQDIPYDVESILSAKLIECIFFNDTQAAKSLLDKGANILNVPLIYYLEQSDNYAQIEAEPESTPYSVAIQFGSLEMIELFLSHEPQLNKKDKYFFYPVIYSDRVEALPLLAKNGLFEEENFLEILQKCLLNSNKSSYVLQAFLQNEEIQQLFYKNTEFICNAFISNNLNISTQDSFLSFEKYKQTNQFQKTSHIYEILEQYANPEVMQSIILKKLLGCFHLPNLVSKSTNPSKYELTQFLDRFFNKNEGANGELFFHHINKIAKSAHIDLHKPLKYYDLKLELKGEHEQFKEELVPFKSRYSIYNLMLQAFGDKQMSEFEKAAINNSLQYQIAPDTKNNKIKI